MNTNKKLNTIDRYDLIIVGAGPAGLSASIYASRYGIKHLIIGQILGGQISETHQIDNYPGIEEMNGLEFAKKWENHVKKYGAEIVPIHVRGIKKVGNLFEIDLENNKEYESRAVLLATGAKRRTLNIPDERNFIGKGISYCATCDGFFYKNKTVAVIGGSNAAAGAALYLANLCQKVYIIYRKNELRAEPYWVNLIKKSKNIEIIYNTNILKVSGGEKLEKVALDKDYNGEKELKIDGLFIEIGSDPDIDYTGGMEIKTDSDGYVKISSGGETSVPGIWAAGDITNGSDKFRQVITAAAEGAIAVRSIFSWLKKS